ncbi:MAG: dTDP-4-dehydrorhamnose reductase [Patescibacteria group bacterium]|nr:dTDP-4-dehydrorhamnose reductase [Patescibacteria group bacterium]
MDDSKIFIVGANGQLGLALREKYPQAKYADVDELDITNSDSVANFDWTSTSHILNAAALTNVDGAETESGRRASWAVNASAVAYLAEVANNNNATLVHISSDYVFDGTNQEHTEDEPFSPLSVYGASKAAGDIAASLAQKHYIIRTSWVIGDGNNFVKTMLGLAAKDVSPTVVSDQIGRLTFTSELVRAIDHLLTKKIPYGTYNVSNSGDAVSWADITRETFKLAKKDHLTVTNVSTEEYYKGKLGIAPRPLQSSLDLTKIQASGFTSHDWKEELHRYIEKEVQG